MASESSTEPVDASSVARRRLLERLWCAPSSQLVQQRLCFFQVGCVEPFGEPAIDRREEVAGFGAAALVLPETGEAHGGAQFPELGFLLLGDAQRFAI